MNTPVGFYLTMNLFSILVFLWLSAEIAHAKKGVGIFESIGKWSYSIYLFHIIFFSVIIQIVGRADMVARLLSLPLVLLACYIMYRLVEKPAHALARRVFKHLKQRFPFAGVLDNGISNQPNK
jgi:peptidoglycan/LPS O-acetylase OafA/YrhL